MFAVGKGRQQKEKVNENRCIFEIQQCGEGYSLVSATLHVVQLYQFLTTDYNCI